MIRKLAPTLVALAMLGFLYGLDGIIDPGEPNDAQTASSFLLVNREGVETVSIENAKGSATFTLQNEAWRMTRPVSDSVEPSRIEQLLGKLQTLNARRRLEQPVGEFGFESPQATVSWSGSAGTGSLTIGRRSPVESSCYVTATGVGVLSDPSIEGKSVWMVEIYPLSVFLDSPTSFRSQNVWTVDVLRVLEFGLSTSTPDDSPADWTISRAAIDSREWTIQERTIHGVKTIPGDFESIANVLLSLTSLRVDAFISDDRADRARFGLEIPHTRMTMRLDDGSSRMLDVGIPDPTDGSRQLVSSDDRPFIMAVPSLSLGCLRNPVTDLRQRQLFTISRPSVSRLAVESLAANGSRLEGVHASRTSAGWILSSPGSQPERSVFIEPLIQALTALRARRFLGPDERTNAEHCFHVALSGISGVVEDTQNVTVFRGGSKTWITFDASSQRAIPVEDPYQAIRAVMPVADPGTVPVSRPVSGSASSAP